MNVSQKHLFVLQHGSNAMLKGLIDSGMFDGHETFPNRDYKHKVVLDKLRNRDDPEYQMYRDKRWDPRIEKTDKDPKIDNKRRLALDISTDNHVGPDHLKWAIDNGSTATIGNILNNTYSTRSHFYQAHGIAMAKPEMKGAILRHLKNNPRTPNDLKEKL